MKGSTWSALLDTLRRRHRRRVYRLLCYLVRFGLRAPASEASPEVIDEFKESGIAAVGLHGFVGGAGSVKGVHPADLHGHLERLGELPRLEVPGEERIAERHGVFGLLEIESGGTEMRVLPGQFQGFAGEGLALEPHLGRPAQQGSVGRRELGATGAQGGQAGVHGGEDGGCDISQGVGICDHKCDWVSGVGWLV
jgi:hypothetical protein